MRLAKVSIDNYRSIKHLDIELSTIDGKDCYILIGINETGKSNILKAIKLLGREKIEVNYQTDCEKSAKKKDQDISIKAEYEITTDGNDDEIYELINRTSMPEELKSRVKIKKITRGIKINLTGEITHSLWFVLDKIELKGFNTDTSNNIFDTKDVEGKSGDWKPLNLQNLCAFIVKNAGNEMLKILPETIFWKATPEYLITEPVVLSTYALDPNLSIPLKNIFGLDGKLTSEEIGKTIERIKSDISEREEYEVHLSDIVTKHINQLWPDHKINIRVRFEGDQCFVFVEDKETKQKFNMIQRSDGFKHFVSILLTLSVQLRTKTLKNKIILLDEPETSLHPSSTKYLRDELLRMSEKNCVIIATHSIFMVDRVNLDRHYSVTRNAKSTEMSRIDPTNPLQEEVIYESLGTSILDILEPNILVFEGRTDKDIYDCFSAKLRKECGVVSVKTISAQGIDNVPKYIKFFNKKLITGYVLVDSDKEGRKYKRELLKSSEEMKDKVFEITDLIASTKDEMSLEDLYPKEIIEKAFKDTYNRDIVIDEQKSINDQIKKFKNDAKIYLDDKLELFKLNAMTLITKDVAKGSVANVKEKYSILCNLIAAVITKIKAAE